MVNRLAVFGNPIAHSLSPQIHTQFAAQFDLPLSYEKILAPLDGFVVAAQDFFAQGALGCNVTAPFKQEAFAWVADHSARAKASGAVNVIKAVEGKLFGDNTDGVGFLNDLLAKDIVLSEKNIIILGSGGAARAILPSLIAAKPQSVMLLYRDKPRDLVGLKPQAFQLQPIDHPLDLLPDTLFIDATSSFDAAQNFLASKKLPADLFVYDLKYGPEQETPLVQWAHQNGFKASDGLGMLIEQAAEAFYVWFGLRPEVQKIRVR